MADRSAPNRKRELANRIRLESYSLGSLADKLLLPTVLLIAALITLLVFHWRESKFLHCLLELAPYWKLFVGLTVLGLFIQFWRVAARPAVLVMPFDIVSVNAPAGLTGLALSRMVFDQLRTVLDERQTDPSHVKDIYSYQSDVVKPRKPAAYPDPGQVIAMEYKGVSVDLILNFMRRLLGSLTLVTGELLFDASGITLRSRCLRPSVLSNSLSKPQRESNPRMSDSWNVREAVVEISVQLAADLKRSACRSLSAKVTGRALIELGKNYFNLSTGDRSANLLEAIRCYNEALTIFERKSAPDDRANTLNNRGNAFRLLPGPDRIENLNEAVRCYRKALELCDRNTQTREWAGMMSNLGTAFQQYPNLYGAPSPRDKRYFVKAFECYDKSLEVLAADNRFRNDWARITRNEANFYTTVPDFLRNLNLAKALELYMLALEVFTPKGNQKEWANTMTSIGNLKRRLNLPDRNDNLQEAINAYDDALKVYTRNNYPLDWANIMTQKGGAFRDKTGSSREANLRQAISCFDQALEVFRRERYPNQWANTMNQKGIALREMSGPDRLSNLTEAIKCFDSAMGVYTREAYPTEWANAQNLKGIAYQRLPGPDPSANLLEAIRCYELARDVLKPEVFPVEWARATRNRANALRDMPGSDKTENMREALRALDEVSEIFTQSNYPEEWANTMTARGNILREMRMPYKHVGDATIAEEPEPSEEDQEKIK